MCLTDYSAPTNQLGTDNIRSKYKRLAGTLLTRTQNEIGTESIHQESNKGKFILYSLARLGDIHMGVGQLDQS
jgi:hypothetical protein